eukprot:CAMPEP_0182559924 /NCGR_PEP_ID=MMETSP1324-20130603/2854_1 /TAXON_ID=236786 /ORGANISM="Florenciella sp., Strain RCC1587" /LENGTH=711 /DNA_ID=CAMNT_0024772241 /DNA_START=364 /DNA_END=2500 /DNA_ORIENTATION=+
MGKKSMAMSGRAKEKERERVVISEEDKKAWSDPNADESAPATDIAALRKIDSFHALIETSIQEKEVIRSNLKQPFLVHPDGHFRLFWDIASLIMLSFVAIFTPYQIAFLPFQTYPNIQRWLGFFIVDRIIDVFFLVDIFINFRSPWMSETQVIVFNQWDASKRYLGGWFTIDILSIVPFDYFLSTSASSSGTVIGKFPKLLKMARLMKLIKVLKASRVIKRIEQNMNIKYGIVRLGKFAATTILFGHWMGCGLMLVSVSTTGETYSQEPGEERHCDADSNIVADMGLSWVDKLYCAASCDPVTNEPTGECSISQKYVASIHWSIMTLTTIGYGDISPGNMSEMLYVILAMLIGAAFFSFVVGTCCSLVEGLDALSIQFQEQLDSINDYMEVCRMPLDMRRRIRNYVWNYKDLASRKNEDEILAHLSPSLRQEVLVYNYGIELTKVPHFRGAPDVFLTAVAELIHQRLFGPSDTITHQGAYNDPFYILVKGECVGYRKSLVDGAASSTQCGRWKGFGFWNERVLIFDSPADTSIAAVGFVETHAMNGSEMRNLLLRFPSGYKRTKKLVMGRLWKMGFSPSSLVHAIRRIERAMEQEAAAASVRMRRLANKQAKLAKAGRVVGTVALMASTPENRGNKARDAQSESSTELFDGRGTTLMEVETQLSTITLPSEETLPDTDPCRSGMRMCQTPASVGDPEERPQALVRGDAAEN